MGNGISRSVLIFLISAAACLFSGSGCRHIPDAGKISIPEIRKQTVLYIPGWQSQQGENYAELVTARQTEETRLLQQAFPDAEIVYLHWNSAVPWTECLDNTSDLTKKILRRLRKMSSGELENLILAGHSIGGAAVVRVMAGLVKSKKQIRQGILLAAAIPDNDKDLLRIRQASREPVLISIARRMEPCAFFWVYTIIPEHWGHTAVLIRSKCGNTGCIPALPAAMTGCIITGVYFI